MSVEVSGCIKGFKARPSRIIYNNSDFGAASAINFDRHFRIMK